ncbi:Sortase family protein [Nocardioides scoriae]|uniref:Sortase family protein n=1 Tax=Nocardioides scoriae TaxID=642780 RepID=A0A1H1LHH9_9ACTN|nr:Sortase family protein [Nocardioides scoriae]
MSGGRLRRAAPALLVVGLGVAAGCGTTPSGDAATASSGPTADGTVAPRAVEATPARRAGAQRPEVPQQLLLPAGDAVQLAAVDTRSDGLLEVPDDVRRAGWWRGGARVGDPFGVTLLAGHVDSATQGLGAFASLLEVEAGDHFVLSSATLQQTFVATSRELVEQGPLTGRTDLTDPAGERRIVLVTCAPPYDASRGGYQRLAVVTATSLGAPVRRGGAR